MNIIIDCIKFLSWIKLNKCHHLFLYSNRPHYSSINLAYNSSHSVILIQWYRPQFCLKYYTWIGRFCDYLNMRSHNISQQTWFTMRSATFFCLMLSFSAKYCGGNKWPSCHFIVEQSKTHPIWTIQNTPNETCYSTEIIVCLSFSNGYSFYGHQSLPIYCWPMV